LGIELAPDDVIIWEGVFAADLAASLGRTAHAINVVSRESSRRSRFIHVCERRGVPLAHAKSLFASSREERVSEPAARSPAQINLDACQIDSILAKGTAQ
jgi:hypothetical protein